MRAGISLSSEKMRRSNKNKGTEKQQQQTDDANNDAIASGSHMEAGEHSAGSLLSETPTVADIMSVTTSQNVDKRFETLQTSIVDLKQTMADVKKRISETETGLTEHKT